MDQIDILRDRYHDSVFLMAASAELARLPGLEAAHLVLATEANRQLLEAQGFDPGSLSGLGPTDLIVALRAADLQTIEAATAKMEDLLRREATSCNTEELVPVGLAGGLALLPEANLALISVPGAYAAYEARKALGHGLHVMIFSDNVPLEEEVALKELGRELGLLVMGPDCGTALVGGRPLGFANRVRPGPVGLVGASGTGLQEVACQLHHLGGGVSHILGTGGRDLKDEVRGLTTLQALELLSADPQTEVLVLVSKPPSPAVAGRVLERLARIEKPSVVCFLGPKIPHPGVTLAGSLTEAALKAYQLSTSTPTDSEGPDRPVAVTFCALAPHSRRGPPDSRAMGSVPAMEGRLHGLFTGGSLATEALHVLRETLGSVGSNLEPPRPGKGEGHSVLDLGDDIYTRGRPHPMIDPAPRCEAIVELGGDPRTGVLLLDLVLGHGCHPDPAGPTVEAIARARTQNPRLQVVASITGTELDPQGLARQDDTLRQAGVWLLPSISAAAHLAAAMVRARREER